MLTIRFSRVGKKNKAQFKITLQERSVAPGGRHVEILGSYDPHLKAAVLKEDRIKYWLEKGAHASDSVYNLLVSKKVIEGSKRKVKMPKKAEEVKVEEPATVPEVKEEAKEEVKAEAETK
ncbi:MAG: 30S ribosomal protein S16 [Candidatus Moranbacteria bacterium]|nr:30S ribosomal protein S16 [Candidatus Moranbacteria bacterium]